MAETVETAIYRLRVEGQEQLGKLRSELDGVTVSEEKAAAASRTTTQALQNRLARLDPLIKAQQQYAKELEAATRFAQSGVGSDVQRAAQIDLATRRYNEQVAAINKVERATGKFATQTGLARHELVNLSRQAQDVAVSLGSGQGFGTVLLQQGTQIVDILGTSQGGVRGALSGLATGLRNVFTVGRVAFGGLAGAIGAAGFALSDYLDKQRTVERSLIGAGRRSGASASDIEGIAQRGGASTDRSVSEVRDAALEFAKIGSIHKSVIEEMTATTRNFAIVTGQSSKEAAQSLAGAFTNLRGLDELNQKFNFLDGPTRNLIERFLALGQTTEAAALANRKLSEALSGADATLSGTERGWQAVTKAISDYWTLLGEVTARQLNLKPLDTSEQVAQLEANLERIKRIREGLVDRGRSTDSADVAIARITAEIEKLSAARQKNGQNQDLNKISLDAQSAVNALEPFRAKILEVEGALQRIRTAQQAGFINPELQQAATQYDLILQNLKNQETALESLRSKHAGMTDTFAKQVESLEQQNRLLKARQNGTEASVSAAIAYENAIAAGANSTEAAAIKALTLKNNLLQAASAASEIQTQLNVSDWDWESAYAEQVAYDRNYQPGKAGSFDTDGKVHESFIPALGSMFNELKLATLNGGVGLETLFGKIGNPGDTRVDYAGFERVRLREQEISNSVRNAEAQFLLGSNSNTDKISGAQLQIQSLAENLNKNPENIWQIRSIERQIEEWKKAIQENTDALDKVTLNPLYNGRDALKVGYMGAASGLDMTVRGGIPGVDSVPIHIMAQQGERVQVTPAGQSTNDNGRGPSITNHIVINSSASTSRRSARQFAQRYGQLMHSIS